MTIEIQNPELEALLYQRLKAGNFASLEALLMDTFKEPPNSVDVAEDVRKRRAQAAAKCLRELRKGVTLERPEGVTLREYAHIGHRY